MRRRSTQILSILLVLVVVLAAAGCGKKKTTTSTTTTTVAEATTTTTTAASETTTSSGTTAAGTGALAGECKQYSDLGAAFSKALQGAGGDVQKQAQVFKQFADQTPTDIRADFETIADAYTEIAGAVKGVNLSNGQTPDAATLAKLMTLSQRFQDAKFQAALKHIETWASNGCKS